MAQKVKMHAKNIDDQYVQVYPETVASQVIVEATGQTLEQMVKSGNLGGGGSVEESYFIVVATSNGQNEFVFEDENFNVQLHNTMVHLNGEFLHKGEEYTVVRDAGQFPRVVLTQGVSVGDKIHVTVEKGGSGGSVTTQSVVNAVPELQRLVGSSRYYINVNTGSDDNDGLTPQTPFKTIAKAVNNVSYKGSIGFSRHEIVLADGVYREKIGVHDLASGAVIFVGSGPNTIIEGHDIEFGMMELHRITYVEFNNLTIKPINTSHEWALIAFNVTDVQDLQITDSVTIDFSNTIGLENTEHRGMGVHGVKIDKGAVSANFINCNVPIHLNTCNLNIHIDVDTTNSEIALYDSSISVGYKNANECRISNYGKSSIVRNHVNDGIIVESGENENGTYAKYANGLIVFTIETPIYFNSDSYQPFRYPVELLYGTPRAASVSLSNACEFTDPANATMTVSDKDNWYWNHVNKVTVHTSSVSNLGHLLFRNDLALQPIKAIANITVFGRWK